MPNFSDIADNHDGNCNLISIFVRLDGMSAAFYILHLKN